MKKTFLSLPLLTIFAVSALAQQFNLQPLKLNAEKEERGVHCYVLVSAVFTADGNVTDIQILNHPSSALAKEAFAAAKKIRFTPAIKDGKYVSVRMSMEFTFQLLKPDEGNLRQALSYLFRYLSSENLTALVAVLGKKISPTFTADIWTIQREKVGGLLLTDVEQNEYQKLKDEALHKLEPILLKRAEAVIKILTNDAEHEKAQIIFTSLIFDGVSLLRKEKRERFIELHNKAIALGLKQVESK